MVILPGSSKNSSGCALDQSKSTPRFLTDDEDLTEQPSCVRQYSRLLCEEVLCLIISRKLRVIQFVISAVHSVNLVNW